MTTAPNWNFGDILDALDASFPGDAPALIHADRVTAWRDFAPPLEQPGPRASSRAARSRTTRSAFYLRNRPEYCEALAACFKARLVHVNVNYRYLDEELWYIFDNSDAKIVVFDGEFADRVAKLRPRLPRVAAWVQVGERRRATSRGLRGARRAPATAAPLGIARDGKDLLFLYTGGTTGMPKGVMWAANDLWHALGAGANAPANGGGAPATLEQHVANMVKAGPATRADPVLPADARHGALHRDRHARRGRLRGHARGPEVRLRPSCSTPSQRHQANSLVIVGDAFAKPMLNTLEENPGRWDLSSVKLIVSSGVMWSDRGEEGDAAATTAA